MNATTASEKVWEGRYLVSATAKEFSQYKDVSFSIFRDDMPLEECEALTKPFDITDPQAMSYADQTFTLEQAEQIKAWLEDPDVSVNIKPAMTPKQNCMSVSAIPVGGLQNFISFHRFPNYPLSFKIAGYYDLRQHDLTDKWKFMNARKAFLAMHEDQNQ